MTKFWLQVAVLDSHQYIARRHCKACFLHYSRHIRKQIPNIHYIHPYVNSAHCYRCVSIRNYRYRSLHRKELIAANKQYFLANHERILADNRNRQHNKREQMNELHKRYYAKLRYEVLAHYSPNEKPECWRCGLTIVIFLCLDHVYNQAPLDTKRIGRRTNQLYTYLKTHNYPDGYQTLCYNCNNMKHQLYSKILWRDGWSKQGVIRRKLEWIDAYSDGTCACVCCGYNESIFALTLDHINGDGPQHLKELGIRNGNLIPYLKRNGYPFKDRLRVLCCNCNHVSSNKGLCYHTIERQTIMVPVVN